LEGLYGGPLLCAKSAEFIIFYDWISAKIVRRIDISCKKIYWSDNFLYVAVVGIDDFYVLEYRKDAL
jgi:coatomer subunit beta'